MKSRVLFIIFSLLLSIPGYSQDGKNVLSNAEKAFETGKFEEVENILSGKVNTLSEQDKLEAYRILSLSCLYRDLPERAEDYALELLKIDPFYTSHGDSPRFADILTKLKKGQNTVTTASKVAETLEEAPVPVTLITEEMIHASGAIKLQDVLMMYVPGFSAISSLQDNVAMRGIYEMGQEGILVLLDGHRLNNHSTNSEPFDFRNNIDKIKQIEVLRGPASSLYGNVALTAVVNIITKNGSDLAGGEISATGGTHEKLGGSILFGEGNLKFDAMVWGSFFYSKGQPFEYLNARHYIEAYNSRPTFDVGGKIRWGDLKLEVTARHSHPVPPINLISTIVSGYTYEKYGKVGGDGPGMASTDIKADVDWSHKWNRFTLSASASVSHESQQIYNVLGDTLNPVIMSYFVNKLKIPVGDTIASRQAISWKCLNLGGSVNGVYEYRLAKMSGTLLAGIQTERFAITDALLQIGSYYDQTKYTAHNIVQDGSENTISTFLQIKHSFTDKLIFNGGVRLDHKIRIGGRQIFTASPRLSLIWMPNSVVTVKGGYSHSFVDAPVFYRVSTISLFSGGTNLDPEMMDSFQAGIILNWKNIGLKYELNTFYNIVDNLVNYHVDSVSRFSNSRQIRVGGIENVLQFKSDRWFANFNCTFQYPFSTEKFGDALEHNTEEHAISNVPKFITNLTAQYAVFKGREGGRLLLRANARFLSEIKCTVNDMYVNKHIGDYVLWVPQERYVILNAGIEWSGAKGLFVSLDARNILNKDYQVGGVLYQSIPGEERNFILRLGYKFGIRKR